MTRFADAETPQGPVDGENCLFHLEHAPEPVESLMLVRGGSVLREGRDFLIARGTQEVFLIGALKRGEVLQSWYRWEEQG
jgi:hypothetical protein